MTKRKTKGTFTIRTAGVIFLASAAFELLSVTSAVPLLGAVRTGAVAAVYHLIYMAFFLVIGIGLWAPKSWGYKAAFAGGLVYTLDKVLFLLDRTFMEAYLLQEMGSYREILQVMDSKSIYQLFAVATLLFVASWWGFVLYLYVRREYFSDKET